MRNEPPHLHRGGELLIVDGKLAHEATTLDEAAAILGTKLDTTPGSAQAVLRPNGHLITLTRNWARIVVDGTAVALASPARAVDGLLCAATAAEAAWGVRTPVNLPALTVTVAGMAAALERVAGPQASALIDWVPDPMITRMFATWPARFRADRAARLGLAADPDFDSVIRAYLADS